ncbi:TetR/AcrR family transcriptional regulator [Actinomycetospora flava]|uniref:TetR/AcrR family transcriptional regulator n=1 Tax=Actinomycetospora flava TaxID=3129232 RepID=A0ABU8MAP9_9PSEU
MATVTRRAHGSRARRRQENLAKLLDALEAMLAEGESFTEVSVERLAARAGVSRSTFYVHFEDKGRLLSELTADVVDQLLEAGRGWWGNDPPASPDELRARAGTIVATYRPRAELMRAVIDSSSHDPAVREVFRELTGRYVTEITAHITAGQAAGTVRRDVPPGPTAQMLTAMAERGLDRMLRGADDAAARDAVEAFTAIVWNTLYRDAP